MSTEKSNRDSTLKLDMQIALYHLLTIVKDFKVKEKLLQICKKMQEMVRTALQKFYNR